MPDADDFDVEYFRSLLAGKTARPEQDSPTETPDVPGKSGPAKARGGKASAGKKKAGGGRGRPAPGKKTKRS